MAGEASCLCASGNSSRCVAGSSGLPCSQARSDALLSTSLPLPIHPRPAGAGWRWTMCCARVTWMRSGRRCTQKSTRGGQRVRPGLAAAGPPGPALPARGRQAAGCLLDRTADAHTPPALGCTAALPAGVPELRVPKPEAAVRMNKAHTCESGWRDTELWQWCVSWRGGGRGAAAAPGCRSHQHLLRRRRAHAAASVACGHLPPWPLLTRPRCWPWPAAPALWQAGQEPHHAGAKGAILQHRRIFWDQAPAVHGPAQRLLRLRR